MSLEKELTTHIGTKQGESYFKPQELGRECDIFLSTEKSRDENDWNARDFNTVHIEIVSDLSSESFIAALKRFIAHGGKCSKFYSDNAKNFVGENREIQKLHELDINPDIKLSSYLCEENIELKFIPPRAPNYGGLWEAAIKSFKFHFRRVVKGASLN
ncbi:reverse transcriptase [Caerostris darwini]|uniref:Reverse transcriptase n=1 Tax=Caerostris darwini TaxID=1538125 RepID=A0AAV4X857_9ARAC|nr:reverse transcriptase [Caerostris darwini]